MPASASDEILRAYTTIYCAGAGSHSNEQKIFNRQTVLRGKSLSLSPRYIFTAAMPGRYECWMQVAGARSYASANSTSNVFTVRPGSHLEATGAQPEASAQGREPADQLLDDGAAYNATVLRWTAPESARSLILSGDVGLTACVALGSKKLCGGQVDPTGATVNTSLVILQHNAFGAGYCNETYKPGRQGRTTVTADDERHVMLYHSTIVPVSTATGCSRDFEIKMLVTHVRGAAVVIRNENTITTAIPRP